MSMDALKRNDEKDMDNLAYAARRKPSYPESEERYSGVCDVISPEEVLAMAETHREMRKNKNRRLMMGVMASPHSLHHEDGDDMPARDEIAGAFTNDPDVLNTIHLADLYGKDWQPRKGGEIPGLSDNLELCVYYGGENLHAIQLDVTWPDTSELKAFKEKHPNIQIILQIGKYALNELDNDPQDVADKLSEYGNSIDYALLDLSMGKGRKMTELDVINLQRLLSVIQFKLPSLGLAVAGGLGPNLESKDPSAEPVDQMYALRKIAIEFPNISIDAQGGLKPDNAPKGPSGHFDATTPADLEKSKQYIREADSILDNEKPGIVSHRSSYIAI